MRRMVVQAFLVIAISFAIPVSSTYCQYYTLASADFLSPNLNFEAFDQEILLAACQSQPKLFGLISFFNGFPVIVLLFGQSPHFFSEVLSLDQKNLVLRC
jgi:hypothetical protein